MRHFLTRLLVAIVAIPALIYLFYQGGVWLSTLSAILITLGMVEAQALARKAGAGFMLIPSVVWALLVPWIWAGHWQGLSWPVWMTGGILVAAIPALRGVDVRSMAAGAAAQVVTVFWVALGIGALPAIRNFPDGQGFFWLLLLFANLWIGDTAAYAFGVWLGKKKLAAVVSPKKTVAGAVAQVMSSAVIGVVAVWWDWIHAPAGLVIAASVLIGIVGQFGDLFESVLKRAAGEKDSSHTIPGHGGILDRFDSTLFAAPSVYALLQIWPR